MCGGQRCSPHRHLSWVAWIISPRSGGGLSNPRFGTPLHTRGGQRGRSTQQVCSACRRPTLRIGRRYARRGCLRESRADIAGCRRIHDPGDDQSADRSGRLRHRRIVGTSQALLLDRVNVMARRCEDRTGAARQVLVELDSHREATAGYSSRASSAPCAAAARIPSTVSVG